MRSGVHRPTDNYAGAALFTLPSHGDGSSTDANTDNRLRPVGVHFLALGGQLLACYLAHGVV